MNTSASIDDPTKSLAQRTRDLLQYYSFFGRLKLKEILARRSTSVLVLEETVY